MAPMRSPSKREAAGRGDSWVGGIVVFGLAFAMTAVACYDPMIGNGQLVCAADRQCPPGFHCEIACGRCYQHTSVGDELAKMCGIEIHGGADGGTGGSAGADGVHPGGSGGGGGKTGAGGGVIVGGGGAGMGGPGGSGGAVAGIGGHGGMIIGGSGGMAGGAGMTGAAGAMGMGGHIDAGGTTAGLGGRTGAGGTIVGGSGGATGAAGAPGLGGKTGAGGATGLGGATGTGLGGAPGLGLGATCSTGTQCTSGFCADKVCCNVACTGTCEACDVAPSPGTCLPVASGPPHGTRPACMGTGVCAAQCRLITLVSADCVFAPSTVSCGASSCTGNTLSAAATCNGAGACGAAVSSPCPSGLKCNAERTACLTSCASNADCRAPAPNCNPTTHQCTSAGESGSACSVPTDCQNGLCVDGFCCDGACSGSCQACDVAGQEGHCAPVVTGQPHGLRVPCGATTATCGGRCNGSADAQCHFPASETTCACPNGLLGSIIGGACDGMGRCSTVAGLCLL